MDFVFDLDGTICFKGKPISTKISESLKTIREKGNRIIVASARPIRDIYPVLPQWMHSLDMIGGNGAFIKRNGMIQVTTFDCIEELKSLIEKYNLNYLADGKWDYAYTGPNHHPIRLNIDKNRIAKNVGTIHRLEAVAKLVLFTNDKQVIEQLKQLPVEIHIHSGENIIDISPLHIHKWSGLQRLDVIERHFIAFGNDANDISMFENAWHTVMVGHHEHLAPIAKETISLSGDYEQEIAEKILTLSEENRPIQV